MTHVWTRFELVWTFGQSYGNIILLVVPLFCSLIFNSHKFDKSSCNHYSWPRNIYFPWHAKIYEQDNSNIIFPDYLTEIQCNYLLVFFLYKSSMWNLHKDHVHFTWGKVNILITYEKKFEMSGSTNANLYDKCTVGFPGCVKITTLRRIIEPIVI